MLWSLDFGGAKDGYFKREVIRRTDQIEKFRAYFNNTDVYIGCYYKFGRLLYGYFYLDFDCELETDFQSIKEEVASVYCQIQEDYDLEHKHMQLYFSGAKGFHLTLSPHNLGLSLSETLNVDYKKLALYYKKIAPMIDIKIYDDRRVFRMANSINSKTGLYKIPITYDELILSDYKKMCSLAKATRKTVECHYVKSDHARKNGLKSEKNIASIEKEEAHKRRIQTQVFDKTLVDKEVVFPCIKRMLEDIHTEGERNKRLIIIASHLLQKGVDIEEVNDFLLNWNTLFLSPPLDSKEVLTTIESARHQLNQGRRYGCNAILEIDYCDFKCSFVKRD